MNIFILSECPVKSAEYLCDKHCVKMTLETAQILCSVFETGVAPYRRTHYNHPCSVWSRSSSHNYQWTVDHGYALCREYTERYGKIHKSEEVIRWCDYNRPRNLPKIGLTKFVLAMPEKYYNDNPVQAYRDYYNGEKVEFARWKSEKIPYWFKGVSL